MFSYDLSVNKPISLALGVSNSKLKFTKHPTGFSFYTQNAKLGDNTGSITAANC